MDQRTLQISGRLVASSSRHGLGGLRVEAWDKDGIYPQTVAIATTDDQGTFRFEFDESSLRAIFHDRQPNLIFKIYRGDTLLSTAADAVAWSVTHHLAWRLVEQTTGVPLVGYTIHALDLEATPEPKDLGTQVTRDKGLFTLVYTTPPDPATGARQSDTTRRFRLQVLDPQAKEVYRTDVNAKTEQAQVLELRVPLSTQTQPAPAAPAAEDALRPTTPLRNVPQKPPQTTSPSAQTAPAAKTPGAVQVAQPPSPSSLAPTAQPATPSVPETVAAQAPRPIATVAELADTLHLDLSSKLRAYISERGISNLSDILSAGGLAHLPGLPVPANDPTVQTLEAHARLSMLPTDAQTNAHLIAAGYTNLYDIASALPTQFTANIKDTIEEPTAQAIHTAALAQVSYLTNEITRLRVEAANGSPVSASSPLNALILQTCGCQDCESVTSALAYLADLLNYTLHHLQVNGTLLNIDQLSARFCQPFGQLPASCDQMDERVRQVRICVEVLRRYLNDTAEHPEYTMAAYESLLQQIGTSYEEIRLARVAKPPQRQALAERLGLDLDPARPDQLDALLLSPTPSNAPNAPHPLIEENLEWLFGLVNTKRDPLLSGAPPRLQVGRWQHLDTVWHKEDALPTSPFYTRPLIDPDIIDAADLANPTPGNRAYDLWSARQTLVQQTRIQIKILREDPTIGLAKLLPDGQYGLGSAFGTNDGPTISDLLQAYDAAQHGLDISAKLTQWRLDVAAFEYLAAIVDIDQNNLAVQPSEWDDVYAILTQRVKVRDMFPAWRMEEQQAPAITLSPDWFQVRPISLTGGTDWVPAAWLSDEAVRQQWVKILQARVDQRQEVISALQDAVQATEETTLTGLRGILLINAALPGTLSDAKTHALTRHLQIDCEAGACDMTTRVAQAIETLQGVLFGARNGLLEDPTITLDAPNFDEEWQWIGSYATWRAAILIFLYPENALFPNLRHTQSPGFRDLITFCQGVGQLNPDDAKEAIKQFQPYFADVCSLQPLGLRRTAGLLPDAPVQHPDLFDSFPFHPDVFAVAQGGATGSFYWSSWHWDTADQRGGADQTLWDKIEGLDPSNHLVGLLPYRNVEDQVRLGLYFHSRKGGVDNYSFASADAVQPVSTSSIQEIPPLVCSSLYLGTIPASAPDARGWTLQSTDQIVTLDVDGDGRDEVVLIAGTPQNGTLAVGLVREFGGGFVLDWTGSIEDGWRIPDTANPITYRPAPFSGNASKRWGVFVINSSRTQGRIGTLGWSPTTGLSVTSTTSVSQPNGTASWQVNLATTINGVSYPTVFIGAHLQVGDFSVLAFEYTAVNDLDVSVKTLVTVLSPGATFSLKATPQQDVKLGTSAYAAYDQDDAESYGIVWRTFCPGRVGEILLFGTRQEYYLDENVPHGQLAHKQPDDNLSVWLNSLQWQNGQFVPGPTSGTGIPNPITNPVASTSGDPTDTPISIPASGSGHPWTLRQNDQFTAVAQQYVVVQNGSIPTDLTAPPSLCFGVLRYKTDTHNWVCETALRKNETLPPATAGGPTWAVQPDDRVVTWVSWNNPMAANVPALLLSADGARVAALSVQNNTLAIAWILEDQVSPPGGIDGMLWSIGSNTSFLVADIDHDGQPEMLARRNIDTNDVRLAVLRSVPPPHPSTYTQLPARYGPVAVTALDIPASLSDTALRARAAELQAIYIVNDTDLARVNDLYLDEAYYFVPMEIGRRLEQSGYYTAALDWFRTVYDYDLPASLRKIAYKLVLDCQAPSDFTRAPDWLLDPLNPHAIAETRQNSYTKYTLLEIINCLLAYADAEFTQATAESVPRARALYMLVLDLLMADVFQPKGATCSSVIGELDIQVGEGYWKLQWNGLLAALGSIKDFALLSATAASVKAGMQGDGPMGTRLAQARAIVDKALSSQQPTQRMADVVQSSTQTASAATAAALADPATVALARSVGFFAAGKALANQQGAQPNVLDRPLLKKQPPHGGTVEYVPAPSFAFCIPSNANIETFRQHAELNLRKIRHCQNIAGFPLQLDPYVLPNAQEASLQTFDLNGQLPIFNLPALQPLPYRYATLIERTKQLVQYAQTIEDKMLAAIANHDAQAYDELKARQDLSLAQAGVRLNDLQLVEASDNVTLAHLQQARAQIQQQHYSDLLSAGVSGNEQASLDCLAAAGALQQGQALIQSVFATIDFVAENYLGGLQQLGSTMGAQAQALTTFSQLSSATASYERRAQEWQLQQSLAAQDVLIGGQQIQISQDHVLVAAQNRALAAMQVNNAEALLDFITTKRFTNGALYEWMAGVLQQVYRFFLQHAISMAQLAEFQLAFERQQIVPAFIQPDYWQPPSGSAFVAPADPTTGAPADTRGLTGAERLLADITALDQYAFRTDQRKLQLTKTISLAQLDAFAFQRFRQTGVLNFATPMDLFDQDFPGHYLRLIKRVSTSVIALVPPTQGIRATLATTGTSRVVIGGNSFQKVVLQRGPEQVALSSPANATGLFTLDAQAELLVPFEGIGVDTTWELLMPKAANPIDYNTIADVLITIDYTALDSSDYRQQVVRRLNLTVSADRGYSFRYQFADQWYELHHPNQSDTPMIVTFQTERTDFPTNLTDAPTIKQVVLYFVPSGGQSFEVASVNLQGGGAGGAANTDKGAISTRRGNAAAWTSVIGKPAQQQWTLDLSASTVTGLAGITIQDVFAQAKVTDILFVITYEGPVPAWPA